MFPLRDGDIYACADDEILINVRAGDILAGHVPFYPLTPVGFYMDIVRQTKLKPVFVGQLAPGLYVNTIYSAFPDAKFIINDNPIADFDTIRSARHIVPAVSTFSVIAAWLSRAEDIYLPLNGFLNPAHLRECDLVPTNDYRYRYFLFPLNYALPEEQALAHHRKLDGAWKEISAARVDALKKGALIAGKLGSSAPKKTVYFDEKWYVHTYLDAAKDISDGWYRDGWHHYVDYGRLRGYLPSQHFTETPLPNVALGRTARQSSLSFWSKGRTINEDAMMAVNGDSNKDYGFHTNREQFPWWMVDLEFTATIREVRVYNRKGPPELQKRAAPLLIDISLDGVKWHTIKKTRKDEYFGENDGGATPLIVLLEKDVNARYLKITIDRDDAILHLAEIEVYGYPSDSSV